MQIVSIGCDTNKTVLKIKVFFLHKKHIFVTIEFYFSELNLF